MKKIKFNNIPKSTFFEKIKTNFNIIHLRRIVQTFFFILLIYGGFLYLPQVNTDILPFVENSDSSLKKIDALSPPQGYTEVFDTYTPFRTCRYLDGNRIFRACSMHYLTEVPVYGVPWHDFLPHFFIIILLSVIFGRLWCGWVCPLGFCSDILGFIRKALRLENIKLSVRFMKAIKILRLIWISVLFIFAIAIAIPFIGLAAFKNELFLIACQTCPARNIFPLLSGNMPTWFPFDNPISAIISLIGIGFLIMVSLGFFGKRIWCRFCPNGLILSWFNKGCLVDKEKDLKKCTKCGICQRVCPLDNEEVYLEKHKKNVNSNNCIDCFTCVAKCPEDNCLKVKFAGKVIYRSKYDDKNINYKLNDYELNNIKSNNKINNKKQNDIKSNSEKKINRNNIKKNQKKINQKRKSNK